jgi:hypothetical protein
MATLFSVFDSKGKYLGGCSARCYDARGATSCCVCGGLNHAVGLRKAAQNTLELRTIFPKGPHKPEPVEKYVVRYHSSLRTLAKQEQFPFMDAEHLEDEREQTA